MTKTVGRKEKKERKKDGEDFLKNLLEVVARTTDISFKLGLKMSLDQALANT